MRSSALYVIYSWITFGGSELLRVEYILQPCDHIDQCVPNRLYAICLEIVVPVTDRESSDAVHCLVLLSVTAKYRSSFDVLT